MELVFDYELIGKTPFGTIFQPIVKVDFKINHRWMKVTMIADIGADHTVIPRYLAKFLNISLEKDCIKGKTSGVGGKISMFMLKRKYPVRLGKWELEIPLGILDSDNIPPLMGRLGFMEKFNCLFTKDHKLIISS